MAPDAGDRPRRKAWSLDNAAQTGIRMNQCCPRPDAEMELFETGVEHEGVTGPHAPRRSKAGEAQFPHQTILRSAM
jgi:hypothetical protein